MDIDDKEMQKYANSYEAELKRIPVNIRQYQKAVDDAEKELQNAIAAGDKRLIYAYKDLLRQSKYDLFLYTEHSSFLRKPAKEDILYRYRQSSEFSKRIKNLDESMMFCFHGTDLKGAKHILLSGEISSGADRTGRATSFDPPGKISVTNKDTVDTSVDTYMNLIDSFCYPAGCLFVVLPADKTEYETLSSSGWMIKNVDFKTEPGRLVSVVTTPENIENARRWAEEGNIEPSKVMDFDAFVNKYGRQNSKNLFLAKTAKGKNKSL